MTAPTFWPVRLSATAEADFEGIVTWTAQRFGTDQALAYAEALSEALAALTAGPVVIGVKARDDIGPGLHTLHVARLGRRGRHFILFRVDSSEDMPCVDVLRLLHDAMDLAQHLPTGETDEVNG
ncbi:MAG: type II toxin-antitoxin system RelE/ParE family toxin [Alphaproteobacteria bacterium]